MHDRDRDWQVETFGITGLTKNFGGIAGLKNPIGNPLELYSVKLQTNLFTRTKQKRWNLLVNGAEKPFKIDARLERLPEKTCPKKL